MTKTFEQQQLNELARLSAGRCSKCKVDKNADCGCDASKRIKELTGKEVEKVRVIDEAKDINVVIEIPKGSLPVVKKTKYEKELEKQLETAEHYVKQTQLLNTELQKQVDRLAEKNLEYKSKIDTPSVNWRALEQQIKADKLEYEKLAEDYRDLDESYRQVLERNESLNAENDRVNALKVLLMEDALKTVERAGEVF